MVTCHYYGGMTTAALHGLNILDRAHAHVKINNASR